VFPSMISEPTGHGLALFEAAVTVIVIALLARGQHEKERAEEQKRQGEERFRALVQHTSDAILIIEDGGAVKYASPAVQHLFGCAPEELTCLDMTWIDEDHVEAIAELFRELRSRPGAVEVAEIPIRRADGTSKWVEVHLTNMIDKPAVGGYVCNVRDIGARRNTHLQLVHEAQHDPLTQLANRRLFLERLDGAWREGTATTDGIAVLFIDVDNFKGNQRPPRARSRRPRARDDRGRALDAAAPDRPRRALRGRRVHGAARPHARPRPRVRGRGTDSGRGVGPEADCRPRADAGRERRGRDLARRR